MKPRESTSSESSGALPNMASQEGPVPGQPGTAARGKEAIRRTDDPVLPNELVEMLAKGPEEYEGQANAIGGRADATPSRPSLPEISSSPFEMNYKWPSSNQTSPAKSNDIESSASSKTSSQHSGETRVDSGKRAAVKSVFRSMGNSFSMGQDSNQGPSSRHHSDQSSSHVPAVTRRSLAMERSQGSGNAPDSPQPSTSDLGKKSRRQSVALLKSASPTDCATAGETSNMSGREHPQLQHQASSATVSSMGDTAESGQDNDFVSQLMAGASWSHPLYAHDLNRRGRRVRRRANSQATATTESLSDEGDSTDEELDDEMAAEVDSLDASQIGLATSHSAPNLQKAGSSSSLTSSAASSSYSGHPDSRSHAARIRHQVAHLNLDRGSNAGRSVGTTPTPHAHSTQPHPASSPADRTHFDDAGRTPTPFQSSDPSPEASALRGRSQSESVLSSQDPETAAALHSRTNVTAVAFDNSDNAGAAPKRPSMGGRTRSGSLLKAAVAGASESNKAEITLAVIGDKDAGKSTLIQSVIKKQGSNTNGTVLYHNGTNSIVAYDTTLTVHGLLRTVQILEVDAPVLIYDRSGVVWPSYLPHLDGALLCYDATNSKALHGLRQMLGGFWTRGGLKIIVLACKAKPSPHSNRVDPLQAVNICQSYSAGLVALDGGIEDPQQKQKNSIKWVCRTVVESRGEDMPPSEQRLRKMRSRSYVARQSEGLPASPTVPDSPLPSSPMAPIHPGSMALSQPSVVEAGELSPTTPTSQPQALPPSVKVSRPQDGTSTSLSSEAAPPSPDTAAAAFLLKKAKMPELDLYFQREDLIDKLLYAAVSDNDEAFVNYFLIIFRRFARPYEVLCKITERFEFVSSRLESDPILARYAHMKLADLLNQWMRVAPNDFCGPLTYDLLEPFLDKLLITPWTTQFGGDMLNILKRIQLGAAYEGPWALPDVTEADLETHNERKMSLVPPEKSPDSPLFPGRKFSLAPSLGSVGESSVSSPGLSLFSTEDSQRDTAPSSLLPPSASQSPDGPECRFDQTLPPQPELSPSSQRKREAMLLRMSDELSEFPESDVAQQITRIFWQIFKEMTPRDLIRHVMAPRDLSSPTGAMLRDGLSPVSRSIASVNFLSNWVATLILIQPKARRRAAMFEKFIGMAAHLRDMENFDALMGLLAGLSSQPVARLTDSDFEAVKEKPIFKKFRSLKKLMANLRGFSAYRMALASSGPQTLPYLGCHLQDITRFLEGKSDMKDGLVNWTKFSQIARSAAIVLDCHRHVPELPIIRSFDTLLAGCPVFSLENDELYDLSYSYKPRGAAQNSSSRMQSSTVKRVQRFLSNHSPANPAISHSGSAPFHTPAS